jgi:hypothetical protein
MDRDSISGIHQHRANRASAARLPPVRLRVHRCADQLGVEREQCVKSSEGASVAQLMRTTRVFIFTGCRIHPSERNPTISLNACAAKLYVTNDGYAHPIYHSMESFVKNITGEFTLTDRGP